jgi:hypothetical protein
MSFTLTREFYIPKGAVEVADVRSDAVASIHVGKGALRRCQISARF